MSGMLGDEGPHFSRLHGIPFCWVKIYTDALRCLHNHLLLSSSTTYSLLWSFFCLFPYVCGVCSDTIQLYNLNSGFPKNREGVRRRALKPCLSFPLTQAPSTHWIKRSIRSVSELYNRYTLPGFLPHQTFPLTWLLHLTLDPPCHQIVWWSLGSCLALAALTGPAVPSSRCCGTRPLSESLLPACHTGSLSLATWPFCRSAPVYQLVSTAPH